MINKTLSIATLYLCSLLSGALQAATIDFTQLGSSWTAQGYSGSTNGQSWQLSARDYNSAEELWLSSELGAGVKTHLSDSPSIDGGGDELLQISFDRTVNLLGFELTDHLGEKQFCSNSCQTAADYARLEFWVDGQTTLSAQPIEQGLFVLPSTFGQTFAWQALGPADKFYLSRLEFALDSDSPARVTEPPTGVLLLTTLIALYWRTRRKSPLITAAARI